MTTRIGIRKFVATDRERLMALMVELQEFERQFSVDHVAPDREFAAWYVDRLLRVVQENNGQVIVATKDEVPCGFAAGILEEEAEARDWYFYIAELVVSEGDRNQGIGSQLVSAMEDEARARGLKRVGIGVLAGSERVHRLYNSLGYREYAFSLRKQLS